MLSLRQALRFSTAVALVLAFAAGCSTEKSPPDGLPPPPKASKFELLVDAPLAAIVGRQATVRVRVLTPVTDGDFAPVEDADVEVLLVRGEKDEEPVARGRSGRDGWTALAFTAPTERAPRLLRIRTTALGESRTSDLPFQVNPGVRLLLATDKPVYMPGQVIRIRALALQAGNLRPAGGEMAFEAKDPRGNLVLRAMIPLSRFGTASCDLPIASEVNTGEWILTASLGEIAVQRAVPVARYTVPKFKVEVRTERDWYKPGETVKGTVVATYSYGERVAKGGVDIEWSSDNGSSNRLPIGLSTDGSGSAAFELQLPREEISAEVPGRGGLITIQAMVRDAAGQEERTSITRPLSPRGLDVAIVVPGSRLVPGVENDVYVVARSPAGTPVPCDVELQCGGRTLKSTADARGVAAFRLVPARGVAPWSTLRATARDGANHEGEITRLLPHATSTLAFVVLPDTSLCRAGEKLGVSVKPARPGGTVSLELLADGDVIASGTADLSTGPAHLELPVPADASGVVELRATRDDSAGGSAISSRLLFVRRENSLSVRVTAASLQARPGEEVELDFRTCGPDGNGVPAALGVSIVDSSVLQLGDDSSESARVLLTLSREMLVPGVAGSLADIADVAPTPGDANDAAAVLATLSLTPVRARMSSVRGAWFGDRKRLSILVLALESLPLTGTPWLEREGDSVRFAPGFMNRLSNASAHKSPGVSLTDPWGRPLTAEMLTQLGEPFDAPSWLVAAYGSMAEVVGMNMAAWVAKHDVVRKGSYVPGALKEMSEGGVFAQSIGRDPLGEEWSLEQLAEFEPMLAVENLERLTMAGRRAAAYDRLVRWLPADGLVKASGTRRQFREGLAREMELFLSRPDGGTDTLESLAETDPCFNPETIAHELDSDGWERLYEPLLKGISDGVVRPELGADGTYLLPGDAVPRLVAAGLLPKANDIDRFGEPFDPAGLAKLEKRFRPEALVQAAVGLKAMRIDAKHCEILHKGLGLVCMPDDAVQQLVEKGAIRREDTLDPWGEPMRLARGGKGHFQCSLLSGVASLLSAGADGTFGTADDLTWDGTQPAALPDRAPYRPPSTLACLTTPQSRMALLGTYGNSNGRELRGIVEHLVGGAEFPGSNFGMRSLREDMLESEIPYNEISQARVMEFPDPELWVDGIERRRMRDYDVEISQNAAIADSIGEAGLFTREHFGNTRGPARVRKLFPELLAWNPLLITDDTGRAALKVRMADSITTWRVKATANSMAGGVSEGGADLRVFQPFIADLDLPAAVTEGDEVAVPAMAWNYTDREQNVELRVEAGEGATLLDTAPKSLTLAPGAAGFARFRVRFDRPGHCAITVKASGQGAEAQDAARRETEVVGDGWTSEETVNARLDRPLHCRISVPSDAIPGSIHARARVMPGAIAQVLEGMRGLVRLPHG